MHERERDIGKEWFTGMTVIPLVASLLVSGAMPDAAMAMPPATAAPRATRTRVLSLKISSHRWRS